MTHLMTGGATLNKKLVQLMDKHDSIAIAVAWAGAKTDAYEALKKHKKKIRHVVIGTHFYQTHPDVLEDFIGCTEVRFVLQPQGIFHPKAYLFWSKKSWDVLIGSGNLTRGALGKNSELMLHISSVDAPDNVQVQLHEKIKEYWKEAKAATPKSVASYRALWALQQSALKRVSSEYAGGKKSRSPVETEIMSMSWEVFYTRVQDDQYHGFVARCDLLDDVKKAFKTHASYNDMDLHHRKMIAGIPNKFNEHSGWFGSMKGAGRFLSAVNKRSLQLSDALGFIPLEGIITRAYYDSYIREFVKAFPNGGHGVALASRLLAMKRPDYFVCLDSKNKAQLCRDFGIKQSDLNYQRYWEDVVCRITDSVWWNAPQPKNKTAARVWSGRAAMLDAIFYGE